MVGRMIKTKTVRICAVLVAIFLVAFLLTSMQETRADAGLNEDYLRVAAAEPTAKSPHLPGRLIKEEPALDASGLTPVSQAPQISEEVFIAAAALLVFAICVVLIWKYRMGLMVWASAHLGSMMSGPKVGYAAAFCAGFFLALLWTGIYELKDINHRAMVLNKLTGEVHWQR